MLKKILAATIGISLATSALAVVYPHPHTLAAAHARTKQDAASNLVDKASQGQLKVEHEFKAIPGWNGLVVAPKVGGRPMVMYADNAGKYLFIGNIITATGENLSAGYTKKYVDSKVATKAYQDLSSTHWFAEGSNKAPHKMYVVIDPNCIFCHLLYKEFAPLIKSGQLQVRWITAGFLKSTSAAKSAKILSGKTDKQKAAFMYQDERNFNRKTEEGSLVGLSLKSGNAKDKAATKELLAQVKANTDFFGKYFQGTPVLIYKDKSGTPGYVAGFVKGQQLTDLLAKVSNKY